MATYHKGNARMQETHLVRNKVRADSQMLHFKKLHRVTQLFCSQVGVVSTDPARLQYDRWTQQGQSNPTVLYSSFG